MSAALIRQALELVDPEESVDKRSKRGAVRRKGSSSQETKKQQIPKKINKKQQKNKSSEQVSKATVKKLLALSRPTVKKTVSEKIVQRAIKRKPLVEKIEVKKDEGKSILFPEDEPILQAESE